MCSSWRSPTPALCASLRPGSADSSEANSDIYCVLEEALASDAERGAGMGWEAAASLGGGGGGGSGGGRYAVALLAPFAPGGCSSCSAAPASTSPCCLYGACGWAAAPHACWAAAAGAAAISATAAAWRPAGAPAARPQLLWRPGSPGRPGPQLSSPPARPPADSQPRSGGLLAAAGGASARARARGGHDGAGRSCGRSQSGASRESDSSQQSAGTRLGPALSLECRERLSCGPRRGGGGGDGDGGDGDEWCRDAVMRECEAAVVYRDRPRGMEGEDEEEQATAFHGAPITAAAAAAAGADMDCDSQVIASAAAVAPAAARERGRAPRSAEARLSCASVSVYTEACSPAALAAANHVMGRVRLPGGVRFHAVHPESMEFELGVAWQFPSFAVALGCSYFQRLLAAMPHLAASARLCPAFAHICGPEAPGEEEAQAPAHVDTFQLDASLRSTQFTCIFLATKIADQVHAYGLLRFMLAALTSQRGVVTLDQAAEVELRCLEGLGWRLGPFFAEEDLEDNSAEMEALLGSGGGGGSEV